jgi:UDP-2-acetamido-2,6-beta-L-arabino-hexul-4-ose reductase
MTGPLVITGAGGFLGWHVRVLARAAGLPQPVLVDAAALRDERRLAGLLDGADLVVHLAGVNRGDAEDLSARNAELAQVLAAGLSACGTPPKTVVFANSVQAGNGTPYGDGKAAAADTLAEVTRWSGSAFHDLRLPNVYGEHGRPHYNSVVATFCRVLADGGTPRIDEDRELDLVHATDAAAMLLGLATAEAAEAARPVRRTVRQIAERLRYFAGLYRTGDIPDLADRFDVRLFNTYRSQLFPANTPLRLPRHGDARGELVETVRSHGAGQTIYSSTLPGVTRGGHYHLAKVERFVVMRGEAEIRLRRLFHEEVLRLRVSGTEPCLVDMPTMWAHDITNVGSGELLTVFWSNDLFDPRRPDTYQESVVP